MLPVVQCVNGSHLAFKEAEYIAVEGLRFHNCRGLRHDVGKTSGARYYSLYFHMCSTITVQDVELILTEHNSDGIGCNLPSNAVHIRNIYVLQVNGNAISVSIFCASRRQKQCKTTTSITNVGILRQGYSPPQSATPPSDYYGISILVYPGTHKLAVSNVAILDSGAYHSRAGGVSVTLLTDRSTITLKYISVVSGWQRGLDTAFRPISQTPLFCEENSTTIFEEPTEHNMATNSTISAGIQIQVESKGWNNNITVEHTLVSHCRIWPGFAATVPPKLWHWSYERIVNHTYSQSLNMTVTPPVRRVGLSVTFAEDSQSSSNRVSVEGSVFAYNRGTFGGGISVFFSQETIQNTVDIQQTTVAFNWAENGGGVYIDYRDNSCQNKATFNTGHIIGNRAMNYGAGMCLIFQQEATSDIASIERTSIVYNTLLQSNIQGRMGGGVHVGFATDTIDYTNKVRVLWADFLHNQAVGATGGGLSLLHYGKDYTYTQSKNAYSLVLKECVFNNNTAVFGQAIALESIPIHGKRFYMGIRLISNTVENSNRNEIRIWQKDILTFKIQVPSQQDESKAYVTYRQQLKPSLMNTLSFHGIDKN